MAVELLLPVVVVLTEMSPLEGEEATRSYKGANCSGASARALKDQMPINDHGL